ncbi:hypothetical protein FDECE_7394 [Fusarium decemcellulare]|nr:hypothetical protein FDECE_7394 [Fusarium decemcellulare]
MPKLTLYQANGACSLVPHAIIRHFKIPVNIVRIRFGPEGCEAADGSFTNAQYRAIHPLGYVPALAVDEGVITEVAAVVNYLSSLVPEKNLLGVEPLERARVAEWLAFLSGRLHGVGFGMQFRPNRFHDDPEIFESIQAKGRKVIEESFDRIEKRLAGRQFAVGKGLTVVDFNLYIFSRWGKEIDIDMETVYPVYSEFARRLEKLDGIKEAVENEGLEFNYS